MPASSPKSGGLFTLVRQTQAAVVDLVGNDFVAGYAAAVLCYVQRATKAGPLPNLPHVDHRVGVGKQIAFIQGALDEGFQHAFGRGDQHHAGDLPRIVKVRCRLGGAAPVVLAEQVAGYPLGIFAQNLMIYVFQQLHLDGIRGTIDRLDAVDHRPTHSAHEVAVEESDRLLQAAGQICLPLSPGFEVQVAPRHPPPAVLEHLNVLAGLAAGEEMFRIDWPVRIGGLQLPAEHPLGVIAVVLAVAAGGHVENHTPAALLHQSGVCELQPQLGLADAGGADDHGHGARQQSAAQQPVELFDSRR
jgi:hypothetical protein